MGGETGGRVCAQCGHEPGSADDFCRVCGTVIGDTDTARLGPSRGTGRPATVAVPQPAPAADDTVNWSPAEPAVATNWSPGEPPGTPLPPVYQPPGAAATPQAMPPAGPAGDQGGPPGGYSDAGWGAGTVGYDPDPGPGDYGGGFRDSPRAYSPSGYGPDNGYDRDRYGPDPGAGYDNGPGYDNRPGYDNGPGYAGYGPGGGYGDAPPRRSRGLLIAGIVVAVIVVIAGVSVGLLLTHGPKRGNASPPPSTSPAPATQSVSPSSAPASSPAATGSEQQAATNLAQLLASSVSDRNSIDNAYSDVMSCGPTLSQDAGTFQQAVTSRQQLLSQLKTMQGASALPASMLASLTQAWQASISADQDYAGWAQDEANSCTPDDTNDTNFQAASGPDSQATTFKTAFVNQWNPIATQYGLQTYQQDQL